MCHHFEKTCPSAREEGAVQTVFAPRRFRVRFRVREREPGGLASSTVTLPVLKAHA